MPIWAYVQHPQPYYTMIICLPWILRNGLAVGLGGGVGVMVMAQYFQRLLTKDQAEIFLSS